MINNDNFSIINNGEKMAENIEIPVSVGPMNEGERVRGPDMQVELAGPKSYGFELVKVVDKASDEISIVGKDLDGMEEGSRTPFAVIVNVGGESLEEDLEGVLERRIHEIFNYIEGVMHLNQRDSVWIRISKDTYSKGLRLKHIGKVIQDIYKAEFPFIKHVDVKLITEPDIVKEELEKARKIYTDRDEKTKNLHEEDVDTFYGCIMCQSFAPTHVCIITPDRPSLCGSISYFDARAAAKIDPEGPIFEVPKGECLDEKLGIYEGVNNIVQEKSGGAIKEFALHSVMDIPSTSCGCFEAITFYIPEVDGFGIVDRSYKGETPIGVPFSALAGQCSGGKQVEGFCGMSIAYMKSPKFFQADGGWNRVVWLPKELKEKVNDAIPEELKDKIATEEDISNITELQEFLKNKNHPVVENWGSMEEEVGMDEEEVEGEESYDEENEISVSTMSLHSGFGGLPSNVKIILKNATIKAEKIIIMKETEKPKKK